MSDLTKEGMLALLAECEGERRIKESCDISEEHARLCVALRASLARWDRLPHNARVLTPTEWNDLIEQHEERINAAITRTGEECAKMLDDAAATHAKERERMMKQRGPIWLVADCAARAEECANAPCLSA